MEIHHIGIIFVLFCARCHASCQNCTNKYDLVDCLLDEERYNAKVPPNYNSGDPMKVSVQINMYDVRNLDDATMAYESTMYIRLKWVDPRLHHSYKRYKRLTISSENVQRCWIPDLFFHHEREASYHDVFRTNELIYIGRNGSVTFSARLTMTSRCFLNLMYYPYDTQKCDIIVQSYASTADEMLLEWSEDSPFNVQGTQDFSVIDDSITSNLTSPYEGALGNYSTLHANLRFERASKAHEVLYIAPQMAFFFVALLTFLLNLCEVNSKEKVNSKGKVNKIICRISSAQKDERRQGPTNEQHTSPNSTNATGSPEQSKSKDEGNQGPQDLLAKLTTSVGALISTVMLWAGIYSKLPPAPALSMLDGWMVAHMNLIGMIIIAHSVIHVSHRRLKDLCKNGNQRLTVIILFVILLTIYSTLVAVFITIWKNPRNQT